MAISRFYRMVAAEGKEEELLLCLTDLRSAVRALPGSLGVDLLRDTKNPCLFFFIEKWISIDVHKASGAQLSKDLLSRVMAPLAGPPEGLFLKDVSDA